ncbi:MAG: hypothetical protein NTV68_03530 [Methanomicrobiales archaeon]|nr:hypothetical protein [Methanomicrobiales archaeon]
MENPFNAGTGGGGINQGQAQFASALQGAAGAVESAAGALKASQEVQEEAHAHQENREVTGVQAPSPPVIGLSPPVISPPVQDTGSIIRIPLDTGISDERMLAAIRAQFAGAPGQAIPASKESESAGKVRLQKVFRLFEWTSKTVKKYGHDRVDLMLGSYRAMGYISDESAKLVRDITRLMPTTLGEMHEISADEFVSELYELNHILHPQDATLDRDMIEVLMEKRGSYGKGIGVPRQDHAREESQEADFIHSKDRI